ncbi:MAG: nicotinic acid mononucleotide adenylyltransferase, partial [Saprospiraceae bacterium]
HIYKRPGTGHIPAPEGSKVEFHEVPLMDISSTFIRQSLADGRSIRYMVPDPVYQYLDGSRLYRQ